MKRIITTAMTVTIFLTLSIIIPLNVSGQNDRMVVPKYLSVINAVKPVNKPQNYRMTAIYTNRDLYGNFTGKSKITAVYTRGLKDGQSSWNNVYIAGSNNESDPFPAGNRQQYIENFLYKPSPEMLGPDAFSGFPPSPEAVLSKNLIWDMMAIEGFAWDSSDSLKLNKSFTIRDIKGEFAMADIGTYYHTDIRLTWTGISQINDELCNVIEFRAIDNKLNLDMPGFRSKGTEQYWGTIWVSQLTGLIEYAEMYSGTIQEIEISGMKDKLLVKTIRELWVEKI